MAPARNELSRGKLKSASYAEFRKIPMTSPAGRICRVALTGTDTVLSMLVKVGPYVGLRPYEWLHATIVGHNLNVVNAKSGNGRALGELRAIGLGWLPP